MRTADQVSPNDIAVVGMALRVPGARNTEEFWANLRDGVESIRTATSNELIEAGESAERISHPNYVPRTADMPDMEMFDADFFGLSPKEAAIMDPQHRHFLECAWEAMEDAGRTPDGAGPVGIFAGCGMGSYFYVNVCSNRQLVEQVGMFLLRHTGNDKDFLATRASFAFDLRGPSVNVQTACSTSLVAVHYACQSLLSGECDMALAGGVTIELPHRRGYLFQEGEILSPDGHCRPFDHRAAGTVFGSGAGVVVLRRLADATADGDVIHCVIKGSAVNNDGAGKAGYLAPSVAGQSEAIIEAQTLADIEAETIQYVECHGTGTFLGDPIEIEALSQAFRQTTARTGFCRVGSVKSNIGHLDTAAGVVGLIKTALSLKHGAIPATLGFEKPNPAIDFASSPFAVNARTVPWPVVDGPRRAAVNSLGVGGTNAHVIVEQAPAPAAGPRRADEPDEATILLLSAKQPAVLDAMAGRLGRALAERPGLSLRDVAHTLHAGRKRFEHRRVVAASGRADAIEALTRPELKRGFTHAALERASGPVFLFPGGGAQHPTMARSLYRDEPSFRRTVDEGLGYLAGDVADAIRSVWLNGAEEPGAAEALLRPSLQLPAILIVEIALARLWREWGVTPTALIGHSMGENAAACVAGVFRFRDAVRLVRLRGELFETLPPGGMLSVPMSAEALKEVMPADLDLASVNAPELCVVSGRNEALEAFRATLARHDVESSRIPIDIAAHSRMLDPILPRFEAALRGMELRAPEIPIVSNRSGELLRPDEATDPRYWVDHLRSTVHFAKGLARLTGDRNLIYIEVGPNRALASLAKAQGTIEPNRVINSLPHPDEAWNDRLHFLAAAGRAWATGLPVEIDRLWRDRNPRRAALPTYPFQHKRYFIEPAAAPLASSADTPLARLADMAEWGYRPAWKRSVADYTMGAERDAANWLIFLDELGVGRAMAARLRSAGHRVATVAHGDAFFRRGADEYALCSEDGRAGYDALLRSLATDGMLPSRIAHLWLLTGTERFRAGSSLFHRIQELGFYSLLHLAQALGEAGAGDLQLTVVANGMERVGEEGVPYPEKATVLGPALVIPKEFPGATVRLIDVALPGKEQTAPRRAGTGVDAEAVCDELWEDLLSAPATEVVAYRDGRRWLRVNEKLALAAAAKEAAPFRQGGVYLITGGLGDIALTIALALATECKARLALVARSALPPRTEWPTAVRMLPRDHRTRRAIDAITAMEEGGSEVLVVRADVSNPDEMANAIGEVQSRFGALHGVLHAAGVVDDELIQLKTVETAEAVLAPKLHGTAVLDRLLQNTKLDFLALFSSTSTEIAPIGQADYVAANAYMNAYAESAASRTDRRTLAIHWGVWNEVGLAARSVGIEPATVATGSDRTEGPFFARWVEDEAGISWLEAEIGPETHWLLDEHRLSSGQAILPGAAYFELIAQARKEYGLAPAGEIENLVFLQPLEVADNARKTIRARLEPNGRTYRFTVTAADASDPGASHARYAEAVLKNAPEAGLGFLDLAPAIARCGAATRAADGAALRSVQEDYVRFGPRWSVLRSMAVGAGEAVAELELSADYAADGCFVHPALLDIATGFALGLASDHDAAQGLWAPASYARAVIRHPLRGRVTSWVRLADSSEFGAGHAAFDIVVADADGTILFEAQSFLMKRFERSSLVAPVKFDLKLGREVRQLTPAMLQLAGQIRLGILPSEGLQALTRALAAGQPQVIVSSIELEALRRRASAQASAASRETLFERPDLNSDYRAPRNEVEQTLSGYWSELLGVDQVGINDNFFELGGHSLIAVRLFRMIKKTYGVELPISVLFEAGTIADCAELIERQRPDQDQLLAAEAKPAGARPTRPTHLVPMQVRQRAQGTPFFICAGMFGNILNLRHLALHLGAERPVYGLQARGLYGEALPHESFEEMARDCIREMQAVQPHGPYLLGGFSGGGLTALEMARQLTQAGEQVAHLILLDTPLPMEDVLSAADKLALKLQDLRRERGAFFLNWARKRLSWERDKKRRQAAQEETLSAEHLHNERIEAAFRRALAKYVAQPYGGSVALFRPRTHAFYRLSGGRELQQDRTPILEDNGWGPFMTNLDIRRVPGDHDSMVLEPFVRVLAGHVAAELRAPPVDASSAWRMAAE